MISDGEMRRAGFFTAEFYRHLTGVRALPPTGGSASAAHDGLHRFAVDEPIEAPDGLGVVAEYRAARRADDAAAQGHAARAVHAVGAAASRARRGLRDPGRRGGGVRPDPARRDPRPRRRGRRRSSRSTSRRRRSTRRAGRFRRRCSTRRSSRPSAGPGSAPTCASATSSAGRSRRAPIARSSARCSASTSTSSSSSSRTAR